MKQSDIVQPASAWPAGACASRRRCRWHAAASIRLRHRRLWTSSRGACSTCRARLADPRAQGRARAGGRRRTGRPHRGPRPDRSRRRSSRDRARNRLGGRVWTIRDDGFDGIPLEAGGEFIDGEHEEIRSLCADLGLPLQQILREGFGLALDLRGRVQLFKTQKHIWSDFKRALAKEAEAFEWSDCDWNSSAARVYRPAFARRAAASRGSLGRRARDGAGLRGFYLADADQISALPAVELSMQPRIRDT